MKKALITGITGQDGAYLAELLIKKGYTVFGAYRRNSSVNFWRLEDLGILNSPHLKLIEYDLTDPGASIRIIERTEIDEVYNLAAQSFVGVSFDQPSTTTQITGLGALNLLEGIRIVNKKIKYYQASTSEMFGEVQTIPQTEETPFYPRSPYAVAKLYAHWMTINYREAYDIFATSGILFNHESPLRGREFVTRKISDAVAKIKLGKIPYFEMGNIDAKRDWGYAKEYVEGMYLMMQAKKPDTFILATGRTETVRDFINMTFKAVDIEIEWQGKGTNEIAIDKKGKTLVKINSALFRPTEVDLLIGSADKAKNELGWAPKMVLEELCDLMVEADIKRNAQGYSF